MDANGQGWKMKRMKKIKDEDEAVGPKVVLRSSSTILDSVKLRSVQRLSVPSRGCISARQPLHLVPSAVGTA